VTTQHSHTHSRSHPHADVDGVSAEMTRIQRLVMFLEAHFGDVELHMPEEIEDDSEQGEDNIEPSLLVSLDEAEARINLISMVRRHCFYLSTLMDDVDCCELSRGFEKTSRDHP